VGPFVHRAGLSLIARRRQVEPKDVFCADQLLAIPRRRGSGAASGFTLGSAPLRGNCVEHPAARKMSRQDPVGDRRCLHRPEQPLNPRIRP